MPSAPYFPTLEKLWRELSKCEGDYMASTLHVWITAAVVLIPRVLMGEERAQEQYGAIAQVATQVVHEWVDKVKEEDRSAAMSRIDTLIADIRRRHDGWSPKDR